MLAIEVAFLTGRYVATAYNTRTESEWPPHPARLFSALVATHFAAEPPSAAEREVLEWLERQGPPELIASAASRRDVVTVFVPVNDVALTNVDDEAQVVDDARAALAASDANSDGKLSKKLGKAVLDAETKFKKAISRATAVPDKPGNPRFGQRVLPDHRTRQPRTFPSVTPEEPQVSFVWSQAAPSNTQKSLLSALLQRLVRLGHSSSLVAARLVDSTETPTWRPSPDGEETLRVAQPGQLDALQRAFARHREIEPRVMPSIAQPYTRRPDLTAGAIATSVFSRDWLVLRRVSGPSLPMTATAGLARAVRRALMSFADEPLPEILSGHAADGLPSPQTHLAVVPLSFLGHEQANGTLLGVALVLPELASTADKRAVFNAVKLWEQKFRMEDEDTPAIKLNLGNVGEWLLERVEGSSTQTTLRSQIWCSASHTWHSATPVALDRNPGDLRSRDPRKLTAAIGAAKDTIRRACGRIGLPEPVRVEILPAAPWAGAAKARHYPPFPGDASRTQRVLTHATIEFDHPVTGPILVGAGRYVGLGLFRPEAAR